MRPFLIITSLAGLLLSSGAFAQTYPWCKFHSGDCSYSNLAQCQAALSGTVGDCTRNPMFGLRSGAANSYAYDPPPHRHHRHRSPQTW